MKTKKKEGKMKIKEKIKFTCSYCKKTCEKKPYLKFNYCPYCGKSTSDLSANSLKVVIDPQSGQNINSELRHQSTSC